MTIRAEIIPDAVKNMVELPEVDPSPPAVGGSAEGVPAVGGTAEGVPSVGGSAVGGLAVGPPSDDPP